MSELPSVRSRLLQQAQARQSVRAFFSQREVLEVSTELLRNSAVPDPWIEPFGVGQQHWLQTSPELAMKHLISQGSGSIYQLCPAFRCEERGRWHRPEFTLLEWYRVGWDMAALINEVDTLLQQVFGLPAATHIRWDEALQQALGRAWHTWSSTQWQHRLRDAGLADLWHAEQDAVVSAQHWFDHVLAERLSQTGVFCVSHFPLHVAQMARACPHDARYALRFEYYAYGQELANGYEELDDADEQAHRFTDDANIRQQHGKADIALDHTLLALMRHPGLPACAGVALGFERSLAVAHSATSLAEVRVETTT